MWATAFRACVTLVNRVWASELGSALSCVVLELIRSCKELTIKMAGIRDLRRTVPCEQMSFVLH